MEKINSKKTLLQFPCDCISSVPTCEEPWARVAKEGMFKDGTKEVILNRIHEKPQTVAQLAKSANLGQPTVFRHVNELLRNKLIKKDEVTDRNYVVERYYKLNFPVIKSKDADLYEKDLEALAGKIAGLFEQKLRKFEKKFKTTEAAKEGWEFKEFAQYLVHTVQRKSRQKLEQRQKLASVLKSSKLDFLIWAKE